MRWPVGIGWWRLVGPAALVLLLLVVPLVGSSARGVAASVVLVLALAGVVVVHRLLAGSGGQPLLGTPGQVAVAVFLVVGAGGVVAVLVSLLVAAASSSLVGDGHLFVRVMLVVFALGPCVSIGWRCGRWWAFVGSLSLLPVLGLWLVVGARSWGAVGFGVLVVVSTAFAVAAGSLERALGRPRM